MAPERTLVLVHQPTRQDAADFVRIARRIGEIAPDIEVVIVSNETLAAVTRRRAARRPSLVVSPGPLGVFRPARGRLYAGFPMPKDEQIRRLEAGGIRVPASCVLTPETVLPADRFGAHVVMKPLAPSASWGQGQTLMRRTDVRYRAPSDYPEGHLGRLAPMLVQRFIDTGPKVNHVRVNTLFGEPIYAFQVTAHQAHPDLATATPAALAAIRVRAVPPNRTIRLVQDPAVFAFARRVYAAVPEIPLHGLDIVREAATGELYALEINPGGNTWPFSCNDYIADHQRQIGVQDLSVFFDSWTVAARALVAKTRAEAV